jgi:protein-disulfide isomerase-like protein with CxxC motif
MKVKVSNPSVDLEVETDPRSTSVSVNCGDTLDVMVTQVYYDLASEIGVAEEALRTDKELKQEVRAAIKAAREHMREIRKIMAPVLTKVAKANEAAEEKIIEEMKQVGNVRWAFSVSRT